eukprot:UN28112
MWIGLERTGSDTFAWIDDTELDFVRWNEGEPNNDGTNIDENCVELLAVSNHGETLPGFWNDVRCSDEKTAFCKMHHEDACVDAPGGWHDVDGPTYDCAWYAGQGST